MLNRRVTIFEERLLRKKSVGEKTVPLFSRTQIAAPELQSARLAVCEKCQYNKNGICRQCCGGVPVATLVNLTASRCGRNFWKG